MSLFDISYVNVFSEDPLSGNPVAVIHGAHDIGEEQMAALARWTNLSETTFLLPPEHPEADYRLRIFTPSGELPFAGHPTLGSCHAWLLNGGQANRSDRVVQECEAGLINIQNSGDILAFAAPPLIRTGPIEVDMLNQIMRSLSLTQNDIIQHQWVDNGPGWCAIMLESAERVLALEPDWGALSPINIGVIGPYPDSGEVAFEVRSFIGNGGYEDPVTGSLNASLAQWLIGAGLAPSAYVSAQGSRLQRQGRIHVRQAGESIWIGGQTTQVVRGQVELSLKLGE